MKIAKEIPTDEPGGVILMNVLTEKSLRRTISNLQNELAQKHKVQDELEQKNKIIEEYKKFIKRFYEEKGKLNHLQEHHQAVILLPIVMEMFNKFGEE
jgi:predicted glycoside hydrolase/deacetylase ChbG (UPF0249 family)